MGSYEYFHSRTYDLRYLKMNLTGVRLIFALLVKCYLYGGE